MIAPNVARGNVTLRNRSVWHRASDDTTVALGEGI